MALTLIPSNYARQGRQEIDNEVHNGMNTEKCLTNIRLSFSFFRAK